MIRHQVPLFNPTFLLRGQHRKTSEMPPQLMVERFPTILRDKHHMILAVPRGMIRVSMSGMTDSLCVKL